MKQKLDSGTKHLLRLIVKSRNTDGWAKVSSMIYPLAAKIPTELVELRPVGNEGWGEIRLTDEGAAILNAMEWLL